MAIDKVLICTYEYPPHCSSGVGNVAYNIANQLKKRGVECTICSPTGPDIALCNRNRVEWLYSHNKSLYYVYKILYFWYKATKYIKKNFRTYDVIWLHDPHPVTSLFKKDIFKKMTYLVTIHSTYYGFYTLSQQLNYPKYLIFYYRIISKFEKWFYTNVIDSSRILVVSPKTREELRAIGLNVKEVQDIQNGVCINKFKPTDKKKKLREKFNLPGDNMIALNIGRLSMHKQPYKLINIFSIIKELNKNITLIVAGTGAILGELKTYCHHKDLSNIKFLGYINEEDLPELYACADVFITASKFEGGGPNLTVAEALSSGLPCIVSTIPNLKFIEDIGAGIVVDFDDVEKAAQQINSFLELPSKLHEHSKNAREYAIKNLDWEKIAERYLEEFEKVLLNDK